MTGVSTLGQSLAQIERLKTMQSQLSQLTLQLNSGKKAQLYKELGSDLMTTQRSRASLKDIETYSFNIDTAERRLKMMEKSVGEIKRQAHIILGALQAETQEGDFDLKAAGDLAAKARDFIVNLVNERDGDRYLFGGTEALSRPLDDTGLMDSYMKTQIRSWTDGNLSSTQLIQSYRDTSVLGDTTVGYSVALSSGNVQKVTTTLDTNRQIQYGALANDPAIRDIMVAAGMLENMAQVMDSVHTEPDGGSGQVTTPGIDREAQNKNFYAIYDDMVRMLNSGIKQLENIEFDLAQTQIETKKAKDDHALAQNLLTDRLANIEDVDLNEIAVKLTALQIQIEASYRVTASIKDLNLSNYMPL